MDTRRINEATGIRVVSQYVRETWDSRFQELDARNDDGVDGIVFLRKRNADTGGMVFVQVKCGAGYRSDTHKRRGFIDVDVGADYVLKHRPRWRTVPGPIVLVYVDPTSGKAMPDAWWTNLNDEASYTTENKGVILVPKSQRFGQHSKGDFIRLCGTAIIDRKLPVITLSHEDVGTAPLGGSAKAEARAVYKAWAQSPPADRINPSLGEVTVSRVGWRHMCRKGRRPERVWQSWQLLGAAKSIIRSIEAVDRLGGARVTTTATWTEVRDTVGLRARVTFPHRHSSVVQVILRRKRSITPSGDSSSKVWFLSVYERRRGDTG